MNKKATNGVCPECGSTELTLAVDKTEYSRCKYSDGKFVATYDRSEDWEDEGEDEGSSDLEGQAVRFFCTKCGEYMEVPKELL